MDHFNQGVRDGSDYPSNGMWVQSQLDLEPVTINPDLERLNETDLLAAILRRYGGHEAAVTVLNAFGSIGAAAASSEADFFRRTQLNSEAHKDLALGREMAARLAMEPIAKRCVLSRWIALNGYLRIRLADESREQFRVIYLDNLNKIIIDEVCGKGTIDHAPVYQREVIRRGLEVGAKAMILVHNHPSGDPSPSAADITVTKKLIEAAAIFEITIHDHVIVGREGVKGMRQAGLI